jgi:predicted PurR-regulated permease PerM
VPIAIATAAFYIVYRLLEDYLLTPRVMARTVKVSPGITIIATLVGAALLGIIGALVAIPIAATIQLLLEEMAFPRMDQA